MTDTRTLIPRTPMLKRYLEVRSCNQKDRLDLAREDQSDPASLAATFERSVTAFSMYDNPGEPFAPARTRSPTAGTDICRTDHICARLLSQGSISISPDGPTLEYVDRELFPARTATARPTHVQQGVELVRLDLLLRSGHGGLPVIGEVKTPSDVDAYYALVQVLAAASQLVTAPQAQRLRSQYGKANFADAGEDARVDVAIFVVDPERCGRIWNGPKGTPRYRPALDVIAEPIAEGLMRPDGIGVHVRSISKITLALVDTELCAELDWTYRATA